MGEVQAVGPHEPGSLGHDPVPVEDLEVRPATGRVQQLGVDRPARGLELARGEPHDEVDIGERPHHLVDRPAEVEPVAQVVVAQDDDHDVTDGGSMPRDPVRRVLGQQAADGVEGHVPAGERRGDGAPCAEEHGVPHEVDARVRGAGRGCAGPPGGRGEGHGELDRQRDREDGGRPGRAADRRTPEPRRGRPRSRSTFDHTGLLGTAAS
ncbi:MAG: hypothetical protein M5U14_12505 [Acidimicrobiia bacterium]|nr:hypothetical protein [Acidimicrobiia bacterium]